MIAAYGLDPSLRHGVLAYTETDASGRLLRYDQVYQWTAKDDLSLSRGAEPTAIYELSADILRSIREHGNRTSWFAVDWDPNSVNWKTNKLQIVTLSYFMGYLAQGLHQLSIVPTYYPPNELRRDLGLAKNTDKDSVWNSFKYNFGHLLGNSLPRPSKQGDEIDAFILAYLTCLARRGRDNVRT